MSTAPTGQRENAAQSAYQMMHTSMMSLAKICHLMHLVHLEVFYSSFKNKPAAPREICEIAGRKNS